MSQKYGILDIRSLKLKEGKQHYSFALVYILNNFYIENGIVVYKKPINGPSEFFNSMFGESPVKWSLEILVSVMEQTVVREVTNFINLVYTDDDYIFDKKIQIQMLRFDNKQIVVRVDSLDWINSCTQRSIAVL